MTASNTVPTDRRSFRTSPKKILEDQSIQDLKIAKRTSKDLFFIQELLLTRFFKMTVFFTAVVQTKGGVTAAPCVHLKIKSHHISKSSLTNPKIITFSKFAIRYFNPRIYWVK